jgi:pseudaminic acid synthase
MDIGGFTIGAGRTFVVAELSANHGGSFDVAARTIRAMHAAGADAVKLQTYTPDSLALDCDNAYFAPKRDGIWKGRRGYELFQEAMTPWEWQGELKRLAEAQGMVCFSSPFDAAGVDFLAGLDVPAYKIASFEITDIPLIERCAAQGRPVVISTGVALPEDIDAALAACRRAGNEAVMLLKCVSAYPAPMEDMNLHQIARLRETWGVPVGLSDHSEGFTAAVAAVALGAVMVEKHFILDRGMGGPDAAFSMEPAEFRFMVERIREVEAALGAPEIRLTAAQEASRRNRRSLFVVAPVRAGDPVTPENVRSIRPGAGLPPAELPGLLGRRFVRDVPRGEPLRREDLETVDP